MSAGNADELDRERIEALGVRLMEAIIDSYRAGPTSRDRVYEALNALAFAAATVIVGTGDRKSRRDAQGFFDRALADNAALLVRNPPR